MIRRLVPAANVLIDRDLLEMIRERFGESAIWSMRMPLFF